MSFINCYYDHRLSTMHLWEQIKGEKFYDKIEWVPYVFIRTTDSDIKTIYGQPVRKKTFSTYRDYYTFCKDRTAIFENRVKPEIQFLAERYHKTPEDELEVAKLKIFTLDIEVNDKEGLPDVRNPNDEITLISIIDSISKKVITFGEQEYTGDNKDVFFIYCKTEMELLESFFNFMYKSQPDVLTGWYIYDFDLPYILNRCKRLFGEDTDVFQKFSPIKKVGIWKSKKYNDLNIDIAGVHILDYIDVYKWYSPKRLERYQLDYVAKHELDAGKLDFSADYATLKELYHNDWNKYVDYNIIDVQRVDQLEDKLGYIKLIQALSLLTKCPMKYYQAMTQLIEGALITHFRRNDMCAPFFAGGHQETFPAAYVKEPHKGMHEWVVDLDITSSYPTAIITLNMSNETYFGRIIDIPEHQVVQFVKKREFPKFHLSKMGTVNVMESDNLDKFNMALKHGLFAIAPCGSIFKTKPRGVIAAVEEAIFYKRRETKLKMKTFGPGTDRRKELFSLQWAIKILLNAMFGITSVPYSRYFNVNLAEAITSCGRHTIKMGEKFVNEFFKNNHDMERDMVAYIDTDSLFLKLGEFFNDKKHDIQLDGWDEMSDAEKIEEVLSFSKQIEDYVNERSFNETQLLDYNSQVHDFKILFKQEIIAKRALFVKKKKYAYWMVNDEGDPCDELAVTGLEIVRSDSAEAIRTRLKSVYELIMKGADEKEILSHIKKYKRELKSVPPAEIAANIGVNNIDKYIGNGVVSKGTPWHVKGVYNYRQLLKELDLVNKYEDIFEGTKSKVVYVKNNIYQMDTITFTKWPKEFNDLLIIDYDKMIDNFFMKKIGFLLKPMNKYHLLELSKSSSGMDCFFDDEELEIDI